MIPPRSTKLALSVAALAVGGRLLVQCDGRTADAPVTSVWSFNGYCGALVDAACPEAIACVFPDGGIAQTTCPTPFSECVGAGSLDGGIASRVFACQPTGRAVWDLNAVCSFPGSLCVTSDAAPVACPSFEAGIEGQGCSTTSARCISYGKKYVCLPGDTMEWVFNGYCGTGPTKACNASSSACPLVDGGVAGSPCDAAFARCLKEAAPDAGDAGEKIFVCAKR